MLDTIFFMSNGVVTALSFSLEHFRENSFAAVGGEKISVVLHGVFKVVMLL